MDFLLIFVGGLLIVVGLLDMFFTVLLYEDFGFLSSRLYRLIWRVIRWVTAPLPENLRTFGLSTGAPLMIPATVALWVGIEILGFALVYYAAMDPQTFAFEPQLDPGLWEAVYLSGVTLATLGYGDITPNTVPYQLLAFGQALTGFSIITMALSYVLNVHQVLQQLSSMSAELQHQATDRDLPRTILVSHFPDGEPRGLDPHLMTLYQQIMNHHESMSRYPIVYYFHGQRAYRSLPYAFYMAGGMAAALRWGLPKGHPATKEPWLDALIEALIAVTTAIEQRFMFLKEEEPPKAVSFEEFEAHLAKDEEPADPWVGRFLQMNRFMRCIARVDAPVDPEELYARYEGWLSFAHRIYTFVQRVSEDLAYKEGKELDYEEMKIR